MAKQPPFQLPFRGSWFVFWGGNTKIVNYHHDDRAERYALDLIILDENGSSFRSSGSSNEDYFAFGQDILAPADGVVIEAVDGLRDNVPQKTTNNYAYSGNFVMIKHADNIFSVLAHLRCSSIKVKADQIVKAGQKLGECGNSGNSTEPHIHFHSMDNSILTGLTPKYERKPLARGTKTYFEVVVSRNGKSHHKSNYSPIKGDTVSRPS